MRPLELVSIVARFRAVVHEVMGTSLDFVLVVLGLWDVLVVEFLSLDGRDRRAIENPVELGEPEGHGKENLWLLFHCVVEGEGSLKLVLVKAAFIGHGIFPGFRSGGFVFHDGRFFRWRISFFVGGVMSSAISKRARRNCEALSMLDWLIGTVSYREWKDTAELLQWICFFFPPWRDGKDQFYFGPKVC